MVGPVGGGAGLCLPYEETAQLRGVSEQSLSESRLILSYPLSRKQIFSDDLVDHPQKDLIFGSIHREPSHKGFVIANVRTTGKSIWKGANDEDEGKK